MVRIRTLAHTQWSFQQMASNRAIILDRRTTCVERSTSPLRQPQSRSTRLLKSPQRCPQGSMPTTSSTTARLLGARRNSAAVIKIGPQLLTQVMGKTTSESQVSAPANSLTVTAHSSDILTRATRWALSSSRLTSLVSTSEGVSRHCL